MQKIIAYFQTLDHHPVQRMVILVGGMMLLWIMEGAIPLLSLSYKKNKSKHAAVNLGFTVIHLIIHTGFAVLIVLICDWCRRVGFGFSSWLHAGVICNIILAFFVIDFFTGWLVHFTEHKVKWMWHFHVIHHADNNVDVTTGLRHHPVESVFRGVFMLAGIVLCGVPMYAVMLYQTALVFYTQFEHANINLPPKLDKTLSYILVSPNMHKVHHHWKQPFTDSNYGAVFSIWDRMLGTFSKLDPKEIRYGLDKYYNNEEDEDFGKLIKSPFARRKPELSNNSSIKTLS